jgi:hypothetical protein
MKTKDINEGLVKNSTQPHKTDKNIDFLLKEKRTLEIYSEDFEGISDVGYLKECLEKLQSDNYHIVKTMISIKDRIESIEQIKDLENEIKINYQTIIDKEEFIEKCCDTDEDEEDILNDIETLREDNEHLLEQLDELLNN